MTNQTTIDAPSYNNQFGWERIGTEELGVPVIVRSNDVRYSPVRIVEQEIIKKYDALPQTVFQCITLKSFYLTATEAKLLNNINFNHCNNRYGEVFFSTKDVIISAHDVKELSRFLNISHEVFSQGLSQISPKFGVVRITLDPSNPQCSALVPYVGKSFPQDEHRVVKFVPWDLVKSHMQTSSVSKKAEASDWDVMYLKMLSIFCANNSQNYITREGVLVLLDGLLYKNSGNPILQEDFGTKRL